MTTIKQKAVLWLRPLVTGLSQRRPVFNIRPVDVGCGQVILRVVLLYHVFIILSKFHIHLFIYLIFIYPCIVVWISRNNQQDATLLQNLFFQRLLNAQHVWISRNNQQDATLLQNLLFQRLLNAQHVWISRNNQQVATLLQNLLFPRLLNAPHIWISRNNQQDAT